MEDGDWNAPRFRLNRVIPLDNNLALVQWAETGVDTSKRWPWQHTAVYPASAAMIEAEISNITLSYQQVLDRADKTSARDISGEDIETLTGTPSRYYPELQGQGSWW